MAELSATRETLTALLARGGDLLQADNVEAARGCFEDALKVAPEDEKVLGLLGLTHFRLSDFESANGIYETLVEKNPNDASYRLNLGLVHLKLDKPMDAIRELDKSRELDPGQVRTISYLGLAYARNGEYAEAYESFLRADQIALALEMEQYLDEDEKQTIRRRVQVDLIARADDSIEDARPMFGDPSGDRTTTAISEPDAEVVSSASENPEPQDYSAPIPVAFPEGTVDPGMITQAVEVVEPSTAATAQDAALGHTAPQAVSTLATRRLLRPSEGGQTLEIGAGGVLIAQVNEKLIARTQGVMVSSGELGFEPATRRTRGKQSDEVFGTGEAKLYVVTGHGYMLASACGECFTAVRLDNDVLYLREEYVFAFDPNLRWENGRIPGSDFHIAQFRGTGCVALRTPKEPLSVKLTSERVMYVESDVLAGWIGRVVPRLVKPAAGGRASTPFVECSGEGVVLIHDFQGDS